MKSIPQQIPPLSPNWANGFRNGDYVPACGGKEVPHYSNGAWRLRVFQKSTGEHLIYNYATDLFEPECPEEALLKGSSVLPTPAPTAANPAPDRPPATPEV